MNNKGRKYARTSKKRNAIAKESYDEDEELTLSSATAIGIIGGTFILGLISGKLLSNLTK